jgi:hypothetical protein
VEALENLILKGYWHEKRMSNKHMKGCLRPSIFKNFLIAPLKGTIFEKFPFTI